MTTFQLIPLFGALVNLALAAFVCAQDLRLRRYQVFLLWVLGLGIWNLGEYALAEVAHAGTALVWARLMLFGVVWLPVAFCHLTIIVAKLPALPRVLRVAYGLTAGFAALALSPFFVPAMRRLGTGGWLPVPGPAFYLFAAVFVPALVIPALVLLLRQLGRVTPAEQRKLRPLIVADALLGVLGTHDLARVYGWNTYPGTHVAIHPWGTLAASIYGLIVGYALVQDQLLDLRVSLGRQTAMFVRFVFLLGTSYILLAVCAVLVPGSFSTSGFVCSLAAITISAAITGRFFPRFLGAGCARLEQRILGDRLEYQDQVRRFADAVPSYTDRDTLLADARAVFDRTVRIAAFELFVLDPRTHAVVAAVSNQAGEHPTIEPTSPLIDVFVEDPRKEYLDCRNGEPLLWDYRAVRAARTALMPRKPEIVYAIRSGGLTLVGLLLCGNQAPGGSISSHDVPLMAALCRQLGYAFERMHLAEQAALSERLDTLTWMSRGLAHDLPNAVMPISTFLELEGETIPQTDERYPLLQLARRNTANILAYAHEAMFFAHDFQLRYNPIDIEQLLENVLVATASRAERRRVKVVTQVATASALEGDPMLLQRLLGNLVSNACDASERNGVVTVNFVSLPDTRARTGWVRFEVADQGCGIAPEQLDHIFEPYYSTKQVGDATRGFGLGLTIAQKIVLLHQGMIGVKSELGRGTTFTVDLPPCNPAVAAVS